MIAALTPEPVFNSSRRLIASIGPFGVQARL